MPTYEYKCSNCKAYYEEEQSINALPLKQCVLCKQDTLFRGPGGGIAAHFKGPGFYVNDYKDTK